MKYIFFGTPEFAKIALSELIQAGHIPCTVVCNPDRPIGRKKIITPPPVKKYIGELPDTIRTSITILQPEKLKEVTDIIRQMDPDLFVVAAYAKIIPQSILDIPRFGTIGIHPSLLPLLRGSSPIQSAILEGHEKTGVSIFYIDKEVDHGPILLEEELHDISMETITTPNLQDALAHLGGRMAARIIAECGTHIIPSIPQDHTCATFTKKFTTEDGYVSEADFNAAIHGTDIKIVTHIDRMIRSLNPEPGVYTVINGTRTKLLAAYIHEGALRITRIQKEGKTPQEYQR